MTHFFKKVTIKNFDVLTEAFNFLEKSSFLTLTTAGLLLWRSWQNGSFRHQRSAVRIHTQSILFTINRIKKLYSKNEYKRKNLTKSLFCCQGQNYGIANFHSILSEFYKVHLLWEIFTQQETYIRLRLDSLLLI